MKIYAGIGARSTPTEILCQMTYLGMMLGSLGWTLRSGGQRQGADQAFEDGCLSVMGKKEIYLPWDGFCDKHHDGKEYFNSVDDYIIERSLEFHPNPRSLGEPAKKLMGRNSQITHGNNLGVPVDMVICWTPAGKTVGGTGHAIRIAEHFRIPVFNLANPGALDNLETCLNFMS